jgi:hypothetical protein
MPLCMAPARPPRAPRPGAPAPARAPPATGRGAPAALVRPPVVAAPPVGRAAVGRPELPPKKRGFPLRQGNSTV